TFPELLAKKTRAPLGYVCYFATPVNDQRFTFPNLPSYNFPGVTGWPALPVDNRGFRVRGAERLPTPPMTAADSAHADTARAAIAAGRGTAADSALLAALAGRSGGGGGRGAVADSAGGRAGRGAVADSATGRGGGR